MIQPRKLALVFTTAGLLALTTACGEQVENVTDQAQEATSEVSKTVEGVQKKVSETAETAKQEVSELTSLAGGAASFRENASNTLAAVQEGDFDRARTEVEKLQKSWSGISDQVKEKSGETYTQIETNLETLKTEINSESPNQDQLVATAKDLIASITGISL
ncbi:hypothetical protein [Lyngbya confervoides]|uniref:Lipoprotein n=1 Tax=Lyngbya confervoides BDU141951 TaxID=1574623 RepID=A0ABD4T575_9CYAN|nr:hypothetical protein [Lyngbya confervoides]MCM1983397.1 hypothetical protein [Lyngbya confervoides BDU141951]